MGMKIRDKLCLCKHCGISFLAADVKAKQCENCLRLTFTICACGCDEQLIRKTWQLKNICYATGHSTRGKTYAEIHGDTRPACGYQIGYANVAKQSNIRDKIRRAMLTNHPAHNPTTRHIWIEQALHMRSKTNKVSNLEKTLAPFLRSWTQQYIVAGFKLDFARPELKRALEINGCWFHACAECGIVASAPRQKASIANDEKKRNMLTALGWRIDVLWEHTLMQELTLC